MPESVYSSYWYRVAELRPRLRGHATLHRHDVRGEAWYVLQDAASGRNLRLSTAAWWICGLMDGRRTVHEIWETTTRRLGDDAPSQDETIQLLARLHANDVLLCDVPPDSVELFNRFERQERKKLMGRFANPLSLRFPLLDPEPWLARALPAVRPLFGWAGFAVWGAVVASALVLAGAHWDALTFEIADRALAPENLLVLVLVYPLVKAVHECGHAFATQVWGGEVHEAGIVLLALMPIPYVDASASTAFRSRRRRIVVSAAGMMVELFLAALALFVWLLVEPGFVQDVAWNVMLIGGVSTVLFNGNPLLRFDGYYVFADLIDVPNLGQRSNRYLAWWLERRVFGVAEAQSPVTARGEAGWFAAYGIAAFVYRIFVMAAIALFVAERFPVIGVALALLALVTQIVLPVAKGVNFLLASPRLRRQRNRAVGASAAALLLVLALVCLFPLPLRTRAEGVIWLPERSQVRAGADGFVRRIVAEPNVAVSEGQPLVETEDPFLDAEVKLLEARVAEHEAELDAVRLDDLVRARILEEEIATARAELARARERAAEAVVRAPSSGSFVLPRPGQLPDRFLRKGEVMGYVTDFSTVTARVVVPQADVALVRERTRGVEVRLASRMSETLPAEILREVPMGTNRLPSRALGQEGGGPFAVDPLDPDGLSALATVFQFDVGLPDDAPVAHVGGRVHVRFDHGTEPLAGQAWRALRRVLLRRLGV